MTTYSPGRCLVWSGGLPFGLFTGRRTFTLSAQADDTHFDMREEFTGLFSGLIWRSMPDLKPSFDKFADGLKRSAEGGPQ